jgi:hypothetical protein
MTTPSEHELRKPCFDWLCNVLCCCSCSRRVEKTLGERRLERAIGPCSLSYFVKSPAFVMLVIDLSFLVSLVWVLYDAALVMHQQSYSAWWAMPAGFAAPTLVLFLIKVRYNRRMCRQAWRDDILWNMRVIHFPMISALLNTFMISAWLLVAPLYVVEIATLNSSSADAMMMNNQNSTLVRSIDIQTATVSLLQQPSSVVLMISYLLSIIFSVFVSVLHRRVVIKFIKFAINEHDIETGLGTLDNSLLTHAEREAKHRENNDDETTKDYTLDGNLLKHSREDHDNDDVGTMYSIPLTTSTAMIQEFNYDEKVPQVDVLPILPPKKNDRQRTLSKQLAQEASSTLARADNSTLARQADTLSRYDTARRNSNTTPPPPGYGQRKPPFDAGDDTTQPPDRAEESGERLDSPRSARRAQGRNSPRARSDSTSKPKKK